MKNRQNIVHIEHTVACLPIFGINDTGETHPLERKFEVDAKEWTVKAPKLLSIEDEDILIALYALAQTSLLGFFSVVFNSPNDIDLQFTTEELIEKISPVKRNIKQVKDSLQNLSEVRVFDELNREKRILSYSLEKEIFKVTLYFIKK